MYVTATTLEYSHAGSNKFYRLYQAEEDDTNLYLQYGSQNNGRSGGQFHVLPHNSLGARDREYIKRLNEKRGEGYVKVKPETGGFEVADYEHTRALHGDATRGFAKWLSWQYDKDFPSRGNTPPKKAPGSPTPSTPVADPAGKGTLEILNDRLLAAIILASSDPIKGMAQLAIIRADLVVAKTEMRKLEDYADTLEMMTEDAL